MKKIFFLSVFVYSISASSTSPKGTADSLFPDINGFTRALGEKTYTPDNLFDLIDGAADLFLTYEFEELNIAEYSRADIKYIRVEIYRHSTSSNAFGIYAQERPTKTEFLHIAGQGYLEEGALNFWAGKYYVRMSTNDRNGQVQEALQIIASNVAASLKQDISFPKEFQFFPVNKKKQNSEMYINQDFLGYKFFPCAYIVEYDAWKLFIIKCSNATTARQTLKKYFDALQCTADTTQVRLISVTDPHQGDLLLQRCNAMVVGAMEYSNAAEAKQSLLFLITNVEREKSK